MTGRASPEYYTDYDEDARKAWRDHNQSCKTCTAWIMRAKGNAYDAGYPPCRTGRRLFRAFRPQLRPEKQ